MAWYRELMQDVKRARAYLPKAPRTVEELAEWQFKTQAPSRAVLMVVSGMALLETMLEHGRRRWKPKHRAMLGALAAASV